MWVFFALASRFLWSGCGVLDQVLARAHGRHRVLSVLTLQLCAYLPFSLMAYFMLGGAVPWSPWIALALLVYVGALLPYYKALQSEQAYNIVPYFELTPVFLTLLALTLRHEQLSPVQGAAAALVVGCGFAFAWDFKHGRVKGRILAMMAVSALLAALQQFCFKSASETVTAWAVAFYYTLGQALLGLVMLAGIGPARREVVRVVKATAGRTLGLAAGSGLLSFLAMASLVEAFRTAPSTPHVAALSGTQPFFSFLLAAVLGGLIPKHYEPFVMDRELRVKMLLILGIFAGVYVLALN